MPKGKAKIRIHTDESNLLTKICHNLYRIFALCDEKESSFEYRISGIYKDNVNAIKVN